MDNLFIFRRFSIETTPTPLEGEHAALEQSGAAAPPSSALSLFPIRNLLHSDQGSNCLATKIVACQNLGIANS